MASRNGTTKLDHRRAVKLIYTAISYGIWAEVRLDFFSAPRRERGRESASVLGKLRRKSKNCARSTLSSVIRMLSDRKYTWKNEHQCLDSIDKCPRLEMPYVFIEIVLCAVAHPTPPTPGKTPVPSHRNPRRTGVLGNFAASRHRNSRATARLKCTLMT